MVVLPIVTRELRVIARRPSTYWGRVGVGAAMIAFSSYLLVTLGRIRLGLPGFAVGTIFLATLSNMAFCYACLAGIRGSADSISREKREGTLGLLFLTDLKGYDVAFGKMFSASVAAFYALLTTVPVLAMALILGGVDGPTVLRLALALLNSLFFASAAGLFVSTFSRNARKALAASTFLVALYLVFLPIAADSARAAGKTALAGWCDLMNPGHTASLASQARGYTWPYWQSLLATHLNAWLFLGVASWMLPRCWQEKGVTVDIGWRGRWRQWCYGNARVRGAFRNELVAVNPFYWLASRTRLGPSIVWLTLVALTTVIVSLLWGPSAYLQLYIFLIVSLHSTLKFWTAAEASHHLEEQRHSGALEMLLACTPLSPKDIIRGQWLALRRQFLWPMIIVLCVDFALTIAVARQYIPFPRSVFSLQEIDHFRVCVYAAMIIMVADWIAIGWVAMWEAMIQPTVKRASAAAVRQILFYPWVAFALVTMATRIRAFYLYVVFWFVISLGFDLFLADKAHQRLLRHFRALAAARSEHIGFMGRLGRFLGGVVATTRRSPPAAAR